MDYSYMLEERQLLFDSISYMYLTSLSLQSDTTTSTAPTATATVTSPEMCAAAVWQTTEPPATELSE